MKNKLVADNAKILSPLFKNLDQTPTSQTPEYKALQTEAAAITQIPMRELLNVPARPAYTYNPVMGLVVDFSRQYINDDIVNTLCKLANRKNMMQWVEWMYTGKKINFTENRAVLHVALRNVDYIDDKFVHRTSIYVDGKDVMPEVCAELNKMAKIADMLNSGELKGYTGEPIKDIVVAGIGGSYLGPLFVYQALDYFRQDKSVNFHFCETQDKSKLDRILADKNPATTMGIVISKTFTTPETMGVARQIRQWHVEKVGSGQHIDKHFLAVSTALDKVKEFGINPETAIGFWDWVGGRYSIHSAVGLPNMMAIGTKNFAQFLRGSYDMDQHFRYSPLHLNVPFLKGALQFYNNNILEQNVYYQGAYSDLLSLNTMFAQQEVNESDGKPVDIFGRKLDLCSSPFFFGNVCPGDQHSFFQQLLQANAKAQVELIGVINNPAGNTEMQGDLLTQMVAQARSMSVGKTADEVRADGKTPEWLVPFKVFEGNRSVTLTWMHELTPYTLGASIALGQHRTFVEGVLTGINSFDQFGVELGKENAKKAKDMITSGGIDPTMFDKSSVNSFLLLNRFLAKYFPIK